MEHLDDQKIKTIIAKAKKLASIDGFAQDGDDFAQDAILSLMRGRKAHLKHMLIDYKRKNYSDPRLGSGLFRYNERINYCELNEELCEMQYNKESLDFSNFQDQLDSKSRAIMTLRHKWGFTEKEIGECFGVSEGRVSQHLKEIEQKLAKHVLQEAIK